MLDVTAMTKYVVIANKGKSQNLVCLVNLFKDYKGTYLIADIYIYIVALTEVTIIKHTCV